MLSRIGIGVLAALLCGAPAAGQQPATSNTQDRLLRVYLDCNQCDTNYLVENVGFIDYVRDRADSDLHVLVTTQGTGGGGTEWTLQFIGSGRFEGQERTLAFNTLQTATDDDRRKEFARVFKMGLVGYAALTPAAPSSTSPGSGPMACRPAETIHGTSGCFARKSTATSTARSE